MRTYGVKSDGHIHIIPNECAIGDYDKWCAVVGRDIEREITIASTQRQCFIAARIYARRAGCKVMIHDKKGDVRRSYSYGHKGSRLKT